MAMDAAELRAALDTLGLKQTGQNGLDQFLGIHGTSVRRWTRDASPIPDSVAMLLRLMIARRLKPDKVRELYGMPDSRDAGRRA